MVARSLCVEILAANPDLRRRIPPALLQRVGAVLTEEPGKAALTVVSMQSVLEEGDVGPSQAKDAQIEMSVANNGHENMKHNAEDGAGLGGGSFSDL